MLKATFTKLEGTTKGTVLRDCIVAAGSVVHVLKRSEGPHLLVATQPANERSIRFVPSTWTIWIESDNVVFGE